MSQQSDKSVKPLLTEPGCNELHGLVQRFGQTIIYFSGHVKAALDSLCGVSKALKFKAVPPRYHCNGESLYGDRAVELEPSGVGALVSA